MKKISLILALTICSATIFTACGNSGSDIKETTVAETTTIEETTKQEETTTEEPTTEEVTYSKQYEFFIRSDKKDMFDGLVIEKGHKFVLNDIMGENEGFTDEDRGRIALMLVSGLFNECNPSPEEIGRILFPNGAQIQTLPFDQNLVIEYTGDEKLIFEFEEIYTHEYINSNGETEDQEWVDFIIHPVE